MDKGKEGLIGLDEIRGLVYTNAEKAFAHTTYREELERFYLLAQGDYKAVDETERMMDADMQGKLSKDPLRNYLYLFIVNTGLATRFAIEAGAPQEIVYSISDIYIQKADEARSIDEIKKLNREVWTRLVDTVNESRSEKRYSKTVSKCIDHITSHFNRKITLKELAMETGVTTKYLASLFKKETGLTIGDYVTRLRIDSAKALLTRTDYPYLNIALSLGFCSQSHFTKSFRDITGFTPKEYRTTYNDTAFSKIN